MLPYGYKIEIAAALCVGSVGADSISARGVWWLRKVARGVEDAAPYV